MTTPPVFVCGLAELDRDMVVLSGAEGAHAARSRRLAPGEVVRLTDGAGTLADCVVTAVSPADGQLRLSVTARTRQAPPQPRLVVVQAIPKGDRGELAVELMTEAGADVIVPWQAERCVPVWRGDRAGRALRRWRSAASEAAKQSRRTWFPEITGPAGTADVADLTARAALAVLLEAGAARHLGQLPVPSQGDVVVIVGPEGGVSPAEAALLAGAGAVAARLGPLILRTSTAAAVATAVLLSRGGRWD